MVINTHLVVGRRCIDKEVGFFSGFDEIIRNSQSYVMQILAWFN